MLDKARPCRRSEVRRIGRLRRKFVLCTDEELRNRAEVGKEGRWGDRAKERIPA